MTHEEIQDILKRWGAERDIVYLAAEVVRLQDQKDGLIPALMALERSVYESTNRRIRVVFVGPRIFAALREELRSKATTFDGETYTQSLHIGGLEICESFGEGHRMNRRNAPLRRVIARTGTAVQLDCGHKGTRKRVTLRARCLTCLYLMQRDAALFLAA